MKITMKVYNENKAAGLEKFNDRLKHTKYLSGQCISYLARHGIKFFNDRSVVLVICTFDSKKMLMI